MPTFSANVELRMDAEQLEDVGSQLRELAQAARGLGFEFVRGEVQLGTGEEDDSGGWTAYGPST